MTPASAMASDRSSLTAVTAAAMILLERRRRDFDAAFEVGTVIDCRHRLPVEVVTGMVPARMVDVVEHFAAFLAMRRRWDDDE